jgi:hypothetical protein
MSSLTSNNNTSKLHPIYVALDAHQYNRAIKLAAALPDSNVLGKALLVHAYSKAGQRYDALVALQSVLILHSGISSSHPHFFWELQQEIESCLTICQQRMHDQQQLSSNSPSPATSAPQQQQQQPSTQAASNKKGGKKGGKKKPSAAASTPSAKPVKNNSCSAPPPKSLPSWDWIDLLNTPPSLPDHWDELPPPKLAITDEVRGTISQQ